VLQSLLHGHQSAISLLPNSHRDAQQRGIGLGCGALPGGVASSPVHRFIGFPGIRAAPKGFAMAGKLPIFAKRDLDGFFGLAIDNLVQLLLILALCGGLVGMSGDNAWYIYKYILPGAAVSLVLGNVFYAIQAHWVARRERRSDVTALPYGINTVSLLVFVFFQIHHHYRDVAKRLSREQSEPVRTHPVVTIILVDNVHAETVRMVNFAKSLGHPWKAVHVCVSPERLADTMQKWAKRVGEGELVILDSPYRQLSEPIQQYILSLQAQDPDTFVHVIMGHLVMPSFWEQALHQNSAYIFNLALGQMENVVVTTVPYQIYRHPLEGNGNGNGHAKPGDKSH